MRGGHELSLALIFAAAPALGQERPAGPGRRPGEVRVDTARYLAQVLAAYRAADRDSGFAAAFRDNQTGSMQGFLVRHGAPAAANYAFARRGDLPDEAGPPQLQMQASVECGEGGGGHCLITLQWSRG